jgi:hypothetical protein
MSAKLPVVAHAAPEEEGPDLSAEAVVDREIAMIAAWLAARAQGTTASADAGAPAGQRDGFYWRSGYLAGLTRALAMLSSRGATLH